MKSEFLHLNYVGGWLETEALLFTSYYASNFLKDRKFDSLEIGVHHGKFFIGLENITPLGSRAIAVDVFDNQEKNIDDSGFGNLEIFEQNVSNFCVEPKRVIPMPIDSLDINVMEMGFNQFGLISIDGGHTVNHTMKDLQTAESLVSADGLVILDDILNQHWAGVVTGAVQYFTNNTGKRIVPFAIGFNKLFCCHFTNKERILNKIIQNEGELKYHGIQIFKHYREPYTEFAGEKVLSLYQFPSK